MITQHRSRPLKTRYGRARAWCNGAVVALAAFAPPALADPLRLIAVGDSLTAGYGLAGEEGFVPQLDAWLAERGHEEVEVVNMGVSGDTTAGGRARLDWALADGADAVILELGANDMLRGLDPALARENLDAMLAELEERDLPVLLAGMVALDNYGPEYKEAFDGMYPELAERYDAILYPFFMEGVFDRPELVQADGLHPNAEGVARMVEGIGPKVLELIGQASP